MGRKKYNKYNNKYIYVFKVNTNNFILWLSKVISFYWVQSFPEAKSGRVLLHLIHYVID